MKKILKMLSLFSINGLLISTSVACTIPGNPSDTPTPPNPPNPPTPPKRDIDYYKSDIKNLTANIASINSDLSNWNTADNKRNMCGSVTECKEWKVGEIMYKGDLNNFNAQIQDDNYQILLIQNNNNLSPEAKKKAKKLLNSELDYLNKRISFLTDNLVINDTKSEVAATNKQIDLVKKLLQDL